MHSACVLPRPFLFHANERRGTGRGRSRMKDAILRAADSLRDVITGISRELQSHPELSLQEHASSALLRRILEDAGFAVTAGTSGLPTAFEAQLRGSSPAPRVALLAEYDALPGIGHRCGHNLIAAPGVGGGPVLPRAA